MIEKLAVTFLRILMLAALAMACWIVFGRLVAYEILRTNPPLEGLDTALDWDSRNPDVYYVRALLLRDDPGLSNLEVAHSDLTASIRLNPYNSRYWQALAQYHEVTGKKQEASEAYRRAIELSPQSGYYQWQWANFLLRSGSQEEGFAVMKRAILLRPELRKAAARMLLGMQVPSSQVLNMWPGDRDASIQLLRYYVQSFPRSEEIWGKELCDQLWDNILRNREPLEPAQATFFMKFLFDNGRYQQLRSSWGKLWQAQGLNVDGFTGRKDYCWNGDFESELETTPLGWQISNAPGFRVNLEQSGRNPESSSLRLYFNGTENMDFRHVTQAVIVDPASEYQLSFKARSENLKPHQGVFVEVTAGQKVLAATEPMLGSIPWTRYAASISAGPDTEFIRITVRRRRSHRLDGIIEGTVWFDDFQLLPITASQ